MRQNENKAQGFTLIELLVVVLIIGILASIALPQYNKAVARSRYSTLKNIVHGVATAVQEYYLANGVYPDGFDVLSIETGGEQRPARTYQRYPWGNCVMEPDTQYVYCKNDSIHMSYVQGLDGTQSCVAYDGNALAHKLCQQETGSSTPWRGNTWYKY